MFIIYKKLDTKLQQNKKIIKTEEHHRRPRSLGGNDSLSNISYVEPNKHKAWHTIFGNMNTYQIVNILNKLKYKPNNIYITCEFINGNEVLKSGINNNSKRDSKISYSWYQITKGCESFEEIIKYFNNTWIDPSYKLKINYLKAV
jgi:hypothetical protein